MNKHLAASLCFAAFLTACGVPETTYVSASPAATRSVSVRGSAQLELAPDESCVELTLTARREAIDVSHAELTRQVDALLEVLGEDDAIRTERGAIRYAPFYTNVRSGETRRIAGHVASAQINVRTKDFERIPVVVAHAASRGLERVDVVFYSTELVERKAALRRQALEVARDKAREMADTLDATLGHVVSISEGHTATNVPTVTMNMLVPSPADAAVGQPAPPGAIPLSISMDVVYALAE